MTGVFSTGGSPERFSPGITGLLAQTEDSASVPGVITPSNQDANAYLCPIPASIVVSNVWVGVTTAGITLTAGQNLISIHDALGNLLAITPDQSGVWISAGPFSAQLGAGNIRLAPPYCWLQVLHSFTGSAASFTGGAIGRANNLGPLATLRAQRVALGAISLSSFNPATSVTQRPMMQLGLS
jgi:hypothetical protein